MAILDNLYKKCYNKCNDDNKNVICHQSPKFALYGVFVFRDIKSRRTPKNAVQAIYIKYGNTKSLKLCVIQGQRETAYIYIQKRHFVKNVSCGYNIVIIFPLLSRRRGGSISSYDRTASTTARMEASGKSE